MWVRFVDEDKKQSNNVYDFINEIMRLSAGSVHHHHRI